MLVADVVSSALDERVTTFEELVEFADRHPDRFLERVDQGRLLVAPGGDINEPISAALARYDRERGVPRHRRVLNGIAERISPVYHWLENSEELRKSAHVPGGTRSLLQARK